MTEYKTWDEVRQEEREAHAKKQEQIESLLNEFTDKYILKASLQIDKYVSMKSIQTTGLTVKFLPKSKQSTDKFNPVIYAAEISQQLNEQCYEYPVYMSLIDLKDSLLSLACGSEYKYVSFKIQTPKGSVKHLEILKDERNHKEDSEESDSE